MPKAPGCLVGLGGREMRAAGSGSHTVYVTPRESARPQYGCGSISSLNRVHFFPSVFARIHYTFCKIRMHSVVLHTLFDTTHSLSNNIHHTYTRCCASDTHAFATQRIEHTFKTHIHQSLDLFDRAHSNVFVSCCIHDGAYSRVDRIKLHSRRIRFATYSAQAVFICEGGSS